jgi:hypothetical protein
VFSITRTKTCGATVAVGGALGAAAVDDGDEGVAEGDRVGVACPYKDAEGVGCLLPPQATIVAATRTPVANVTSERPITLSLTSRTGVQHGS